MGRLNVLVSAKPIAVDARVYDERLRVPNLITTPTTKKAPIS